MYCLVISRPKVARCCSTNNIVFNCQTPDWPEPSKDWKNLEKLYICLVDWLFGRSVVTLLGRSKSTHLSTEICKYSDFYDRGHRMSMRTFSCSKYDCIGCSAKVSPQKKISKYKISITSGTWRNFMTVLVGSCTSKF